MYTKADFQQAIADSIANYPEVAPFYNAGSPIILQHLDAMAAMLAMHSAQIETAMTEAFDKARDATVLADAAMRGIIRKATPARVQILATNGNSIPFVIETGRTLFDSNGNYYIVSTPVTVAANSTGTFEALQYKTEAITHTVTGSVPFYPIEIPAPTDDSFLSGIDVNDANGQYEYRNSYINTLPNERIYHVEVDDRQRVYVRLGQKDIVGTQPLDGHVITITVYRSKGELSPAFGSPFSFEYLTSIYDSNVTLKMNSLLYGGQNPIDMTALRDLAKYPAVYDHNAVFLGEFDFLVRYQFPTVRFLSIWNESVEEVARGASVDNINVLFVAVLSQDGTEDTLTEPDPNTPVAPDTIAEIDYTSTQKLIKAAILKADDSYKVKFYTPVRSEIETTITAVVSTSYVASEVQAKIIAVILAEYGEAAAASKRGSNQPLYREVYALLKSKVPELNDGRADLQVAIAAPVGNLRPELWRYISPNSLTVTVTVANITLPSWGGR